MVKKAMNILIACDKFKGSLSALDAGKAIKQGVLQVAPDAHVTILPMADGGEGSLEAIENKLSFERINCTTNDPLFRPIESWYGLQGKTAYIEMSLTSGLMLLQKNEQSAALTSSIGTGELIADALEKGAKEIFLFVGGSATNDAGIGMAHALGYRFLNKKNETLLPIGKALKEITDIKGDPHPLIDKTRFILVTDVNNPLFGYQGAAQVFARQKGATKKEIELLEQGLVNFNKMVKLKFGKNVGAIEGAGAAGGLGAGAMVFLNAIKKNGTESIMEMLGFDDYLKRADFVISGEGKFDLQTLEGKVIKGVADKCSSTNTPLGIACGVSDLSDEELKLLPAVLAVEPIVNKEVTMDDALQNAYQLLVNRGETLMKKLLR